MENVAIIKEEEFIKLLNGGKVFIGRKPLEHGQSIFTGDLSDLAHGETIMTIGLGRNIKSKYFFKLDANIPFKTIVKTVLESKLNKIFALNYLFCMKIPNKEIFVKKMESIMED